MEISVSNIIILRYGSNRVKTLVWREKDCILQVKEGAIDNSGKGI
jgi:hypothetical protein